MTKEKAKEPQIRFKGFTNAWEQRKLGEYLEVSPKKNKEETYDKTDVLSVSGDVGIVNQIEFQGRSFAGVSVANYGVVENEDVVYTKSPLKANPYGIIKTNKGKADIVSTLYAVYKPRDITDPKFVQVYFEQDTRMNNYMRPLVNKGAKNDMKVSNENALKGLVIFPKLEEQRQISTYFESFDHLITLHQRKCDLLSKAKKTLLQKMFPKNGKTTPEIRFKGFTGAWEQRKLGEEFEKVNERNDGSFGREHWISVAKMYFQDPDKVQSNNIDTRTYVMRKGDIAFEGHPNVDFKFGRFVANDIGAGVVSELFPIYRHKQAYDNNYWKHAIQLEHIMAPIFAHSITSSGNSSNKLDSKHFLRQKISVPKLEEQKQIGSFFANLDHLITLHQHELEKLQNIKKSCLKIMFV